MSTLEVLLYCFAALMLSAAIFGSANIVTFIARKKFLVESAPLKRMISSNRIYNSVVILLNAILTIIGISVAIDVMEMVP